MYTCRSYILRLVSKNYTKVVVVVVVVGKCETVLLQALINSTTPFKSTVFLLISLSECSPCRQDPIGPRMHRKVSVACSSNSKAMAVRINYRRKEGLPATGVITCRRWRREESSGERERESAWVRGLFRGQPQLWGRGLPLCLVFYSVFFPTATHTHILA